MATKERLKQVLETMPQVEEATVVGDWKLIATVVSRAFMGRNEAQRQETVWSYIRRQLGSEDLQNIEFIFTNTPEEQGS
jgi:acid stress-induced BolA-like protein IbaG/YrbA